MNQAINKNSDLLINNYLLGTFNICASDYATSVQPSTLPVPHAVIGVSVCLLRLQESRST